MKRLNIPIPQDLLDKVKQSAADAGAKEVQTVSVSEWVRRTLEKATK